MEINWFNIEGEDRQAWEQLCPVDEFRIVSPDQLPGPLPQALTNKYNSVLIVASGSPQGIAYYMVNGNRVDAKDSAVDQMPFGLAFIGDNPIPSGCLIQHGTWPNRTVRPPNEFWNHILASGIDSHYPLSEMPTEATGRITDLKIESQNEAFGAVVTTLQRMIDHD